MVKIILHANQNKATIKLVWNAYLFAIERTVGKNILSSDLPSTMCTRNMSHDTGETWGPALTSVQLNWDRAPAQKMIKELPVRPNTLDQTPLKFPKGEIFNNGKGNSFDVSKCGSSRIILNDGQFKYSQMPGYYYKTVKKIRGSRKARAWGFVVVVESIFFSSILHSRVERVEHS